MKRSHAALGLVATIAFGLVSRRVPAGRLVLGASPLAGSLRHVWDKSLGDALYTVMLYFLVALLRPDLRPAALGSIALGLSIAIETFQLTGVVLRLPRAFQIALGTTFSWHDMACYLVGAASMTLAHQLLRDREARRGTTMSRRS